MLPLYPLLQRIILQIVEIVLSAPIAELSGTSSTIAGNLGVVMLVVVNVILPRIHISSTVLERTLQLRQTFHLTLTLLPTHLLQTLP